MNDIGISCKDQAFEYYCESRPEDWKLTSSAQSSP